MLFMGTGQYAREEEYNEYLNANGGSSNAHIDLYVTSYFFVVSNKAFEGA